MNPYIIPKGKFGANRLLYISPDHEVSVKGKMIAAKDLGLKQKNMAAPFEYFNIALPRSANMIVAGVRVSSMSQTVTMTMSKFVELLKKSYGSAAASPAVLEIIKKSSHLQTDGRLRFPVTS